MSTFLEYEKDSIAVKLTIDTSINVPTWRFPRRPLVSCTHSMELNRVLQKQGIVDSSLELRRGNLSSRLQVEAIGGILMTSNVLSLS